MSEFFENNRKLKISKDFLKITFCSKLGIVLDLLNIIMKVLYLKKEVF